MLDSKLAGYMDWIVNNKRVISYVYSWWTDRPCTTLSVTEQRMANCHASSSNTERIFSAFNRLVTALRTRLNLDTIQDSMTINMANRCSLGGSRSRLRVNSVDYGDKNRTVSIDKFKQNMTGSFIR